ncbi:MAG: macrocin O-methyltransferase [Candidatus Omnitrophica bacterium]|nr:macrocin O-methyltransferase [Candidatus Omnitrophota bacterium]
MEKAKGHYRLGMPLRSDKEINYIDQLAGVLDNSRMSGIEKMMNFPMYVPRQSMASFLVKYEIFKQIINVHGCIVECGVCYGGGLMSWAMFSAIFEPVNYSRRVIGFDTFSGFPGISAKDKKDKDPNAKKGGMRVDSMEELLRCRSLFDQNRPVGHINKIELVKGDITKTAKKYVKDNPHLVVSLLYLDLDLYEPTKAAIEAFFPRMPKGAVIAFDELNHPDWPGETAALLETIGIGGLRIKRFPFDSVRSYAVIE